jgi:hypothetical protein
MLQKEHTPTVQNVGMRLMSLKEGHEVWVQVLAMSSAKMPESVIKKRGELTPVLDQQSKPKSKSNSSLILSARCTATLVQLKIKYKT